MFLPLREPHISWQRRADMDSLYQNYDYSLSRRCYHVLSSSQAPAGRHSFDWTPVTTFLQPGQEEYMSPVPHVPGTLPQHIPTGLFFSTNSLPPTARVWED